MPADRRLGAHCSFPPTDLFEDIAPPEDWPILIAAEQKTNPRLMTALGALELVPPARRVSGPGASYLMAPFTHASTDRPSRFSDGSYGVLYAANRFETALLETMYHHGQFMARTRESAGWTSQFRELVLNVEGSLHKQARHLDYHWDGRRVDLYRDAGNGQVFRVQ